METIKFAAVKGDDWVIYTGENHFDVRMEAMSKGVFLDPFDTSRDGFMTSENRLVSREEASEIALKAGQIQEKTKKLCSYMLNLR